MSRTGESILEANAMQNCSTKMKALCKVYHHRNKEITSVFTVFMYFCLHLVSSNIFLQSLRLYALFHLVTNYMLSQNPHLWRFDICRRPYNSNLNTLLQNMFFFHKQKECISFSFSLLTFIYFLHIPSQITGIPD